ncbi:MAG: DNA mismatch repair endonuclease MutL [Methanospirillum sp.]|nr:DNA mismatch repair endonuclease MutL [Methanospirillum sp.]
MTGSAIRPLDPTTITKIAAGEVIERPASVVKELVENALDAGAGRIDVGIRSRDGAIAMIRVTDDGSGMSAEDLRIAVLPHTTSKLRGIDDLASVRTLGFRGEALASIAAVARLTIVSRRPRDLLGSRLVVMGGAVLEENENPAPVGTRVQVEELFHNTPARRKFQKTLGTEIAHVAGTVERLALSRPDVAFKLTHNGRTRLATPGTGVSEAVTALLGPELAGGLLPVEGESALCRVSGYVAPPSVRRPNPYQVFVAVNGRIVQSAPLVAAVRAGYGTLLPSDRHPVAVIALEIDTGLVDVNVHPAKRQVRLSREPEVAEAVSRAVASALGVLRPVPSPHGPPAPVPRPPGDPTPAAAPVVAERGLAYGRRTERQLRQTALGGEPAPGGGREVEVIGQVGLTYLVGRTGNGDLVLVDQHAAHERVLYDRLSAPGPVEVQELLVPVVIECTAREATVVDENRDSLASAGFAVDEFGENRYAVRTVPVLLGREVDPAVVREIVGELIGGGSGPDARERLVRIVACHGAIRAGAPLTCEQGERLIGQLFAAKTPLTCPHGRPTVVTFSRGRLEKLFSRS